METVYTINPETFFNNLIKKIKEKFTDSRYPKNEGIDYTENTTIAILYLATLKTETNKQDEIIGVSKVYIYLNKRKDMIKVQYFFNCGVKFLLEKVFDLTFDATDKIIEFINEQQYKYDYKIIPKTFDEDEYECTTIIRDILFNKEKIEKAYSYTSRRWR